MRRDLGDFQTPSGLVDAVIRSLGPIGRLWSRVLEPTCGRGNFIAGLLELNPPPQEIYAIELQSEYTDELRQRFGQPPSTRLNVVTADMFGLDVGHDLHWKEKGPLLVLGNLLGSLIPN